MNDGTRSPPPAEASAEEDRRLGIEGGRWRSRHHLHRGALSCAEQLAEGEPTTRYAHFAVQRVQMLATKGITAIVVFDGAPTPLKRQTNNDRRAVRDQALADARQWKLECERRHAAGEDRDEAITEMRKAYGKTVRITPVMVEVTIRELA